MMSHDDDKAIDFKKLEKELNVAVEADAKYWRENDAKFRAVNQKVATYDEFKDIVKASHLKPLEKDDRLSNIKFVQPWNVAANKKDMETGVKKGEENIPKSLAFPTTGQAFIREWRKFTKDTSQQYSYLLEIGGERLGTIFKQEIGFGLLGDFANCLNCEIQNKDIPCVSDILNHLSKTNRFSLTVQFLSSKEKEDLNSLFVKLRNSLDEENSSEELESLKQLETVYEIKK